MKRLIDEPQSMALERFLGAEPHVLATSRIAIVEVTRAVKLSNPDPDAISEALRLLNACLLINVSDLIVRHASRLTSQHVRSLDAIHLATASYVEPDGVLVYDHRLAAACVGEGLNVVAPS